MDPNNSVIKRLWYTVKGCRATHHGKSNIMSPYFSSVCVCLGVWGWGGGGGGVKNEVQSTLIISNSKGSDF